MSFALWSSSSRRRRSDVWQIPCTSCCRCWFLGSTIVIFMFIDIPWPLSNTFRVFMSTLYFSTPKYSRPSRRVVVIVHGEANLANWKVPILVVRSLNWTTCILDGRQDEEKDEKWNGLHLGVRSGPLGLVPLSAIITVRKVPTWNRIEWANSEEEEILSHGQENKHK